MTILREQILAGTGVDRHGEAIREEELRRFFEQLPDPYVMCSEHNPGARPISRAFNKRLARLVNGDLAIVCDVEVYDEVAMARFGGFSISFTRTQYTLNAQRTPEIHVVFNPRLFRTADVLRLVDLSTPEQQLDASDIYQKAFDIPLIIFVTFLSGAVFNGFFSAMGEDLYGAVKKFLVKEGKRIGEEHGDELVCQFTFVATQLPQRPQVLVSVSSAMIDRLSAMKITDKMILDELSKHHALSNVARASLVLIDDTPTWRVEYVMDHAKVLMSPERKST